MTPWSIAWEGGRLGLAAAAALLAGFWWHARRTPLSGPSLALRGLAVLLVAAALLRPAVLVKRAAWDKPEIAVLIDRSRSMGGAAGASSGDLAAVLRWLASHRREMEEAARVRFFALAGSGRRLDGFEAVKGLRTSDEDFRPAEAFSEIADGMKGASRAWLFSNGNAASSDRLSAAIRSFGIPIDAFAPGVAVSREEIRVADIRLPDFAFLHHVFDVRPEIEARGLQGSRLRLRLSRLTPEGRWRSEAESAIEVPSADAVLSATFTLHASLLGRSLYRLEVLRGGGVAAARRFGIDVVRHKYRIMYLCGRPGYGYSFLRRFLNADPNRELVSFVILRNPQNPVVVPDRDLSLIPFPAQDIFVRDLPQFDLFILENFSFSRFRLPAAYAESLRSFVAEGGALTVIGGENAASPNGWRGTAIEELLPVTIAEGAAVRTFKALPNGLRHPLTALYDGDDLSREGWSSLPDLVGAPLFAGLKPGAQLVASARIAESAGAEPRPLIAIRDYGRGRVMAVATDSLWRWKLGLARDRRFSDFYDRFWNRAVEYLTGSLAVSRVRLESVGEFPPRLEPVRLTLRVFNSAFAPAASAEARVLWRLPGGSARELFPREEGPGVFSIDLTGIPEGVNVVEATARADGRPAGSDRLEWRWEPGLAGAERAVNEAWLRGLAAQTGGRYKPLALADASELLKALPPPVPSARVSEILRPASGPPWLALTGFLLAAEWYWRRRKGQA